MSETLAVRPCADLYPLESLGHKRQLVRDRVRGVAEGYANGLYLWGEGGTSKSFTVEEALREAGTPYKLSNSRLTGKGLFLLLRDHPDVVHVLEDVEALFSDRNAFGVLRSALWGQPGAGGRQERLVVWQTAAGREEVVFTGGVILVANRPLDDVPELRALATRIPALHYQPTNAEVAALMRQIAGRGYARDPHRLGAEACLEVAEAVIAHTQRLGRNLDLRLLVNSFLDRLQWENGGAETHWRELMESRVKQRALPPAPGSPSRAARKALEQDLARRISGLPLQERMAAWRRETGKSQAALYRRLAELNGSPSHLLTPASVGGPAEN